MLLGTYSISLIKNDISGLDVDNARRVIFCVFAVVIGGNANWDKVHWNGCIQQRQRHRVHQKLKVMQTEGLDADIYASSRHFLKSDNLGKDNFELLRQLAFQNTWRRGEGGDVDLEGGPVE